MGLPTWGTIDGVLTDEVTRRGLCTGEGVLQYGGLPTWEGGGGLCTALAEEGGFYTMEAYLQYGGYKLHCGVTQFSDSNRNNRKSFTKKASISSSGFHGVLKNRTTEK